MNGRKDGRVFQMRLRMLEKKDAPLMLEWMHDNSVVCELKTDFAKNTLTDCEKFIAAAQDKEHNLHLAVTDENDIYMGTVSLKHIYDKSAEFGIVIRPVAMGKGYSGYAMQEILRIAFEQMHLDNVFWCVSPRNERAVRFYDKNGYRRVAVTSLNIHEGYTEEEKRAYLWYEVCAR